MPKILGFKAQTAYEVEFSLENSVKMIIITIRSQKTGYGRQLHPTRQAKDLLWL
jgi:hypothetical protein